MGINGLRTTVDVLQYIGLKGTATVQETAQALGLPRSTAHRMVARLLEMRFLQKGKTAGTYEMGSLVGELAGGTFVSNMLAARCRPELARLRDETGETVSLHIMQAERRILIDQVESTHPLRWVYGNPLVPMPLHAGAAAKMLLALMPQQEARRIVARDDLAKFTSSTPQAVDDLLTQLAAYKERGYSESVEEVTPGIASLAVPVVGEPFANYPRMVLNITAPVVRLPETRHAELVPALLAAAERTLQRLKESAGE